jgi:BON domain
MTYKSIMKMALMVFSFTLLFSIESFAQDCSKMTDDQIVQAIYDKIKVKYPDRMQRINVRIKDKVVTIEGWVTSTKAKKEIEGYATKIKCVKKGKFKVENKLGTSIPGGCTPGTKPCGSICIPEGERCNIRG